MLTRRTAAGSEQFALPRPAHAAPLLFRDSGQQFAPYPHKDPTKTYVPAPTLSKVGSRETPAFPSASRQSQVRRGMYERGLTLDKSRTRQQTARALQYCTIPAALQVCLYRKMACGPHLRTHQCFLPIANSPRIPLKAAGLA